VALCHGAQDALCWNGDDQTALGNTQQHCTQPFCAVFNANSWWMLDID
jgi:hypothetical protein